MNLHIPTAAEFFEKGQSPDILFWVGCAGAFDDRYKSVTKSIIEILTKLNINYAVLGPEEACTGDPARRAGNEFLFQMQALPNIATLNNYGIKRILTACPHCFNTIKNEYPALGGHYDVVHHSQFIQELIDKGLLKLKDGHSFKGKRITYHDSCYLGRANDIYEAPRAILEQLDADLVEMRRTKKNGLCCGAGGAQMFKEPEKGKRDINVERAEEALATDADIIAVGCPFCMTMMSDGVKHFEKENSVKVLDLVELIAKSQA